MYTVTLAFIACVLQIYGHFRYNRESGIYPNPTSWTLWGWTSLIDALNYEEMTGDWQKNLLPFTCAICCIVTWVICAVRSKFQFKKMKVSDWITLALCTISLVTWKRFGLVTEANLILQVDNAISFIPIIVGVARDPEEEKPSAWMWWTVSYILGSLVVGLRLSQWEELVYPAGCAFLHLLVGLLALRRPKTDLGKSTESAAA